MGAGEEIALKAAVLIHNGTDGDAVFFYLVHRIVGKRREEGVALLVGEIAAVFQHAVHHGLLTLAAQQTAAAAAAAEVTAAHPKDGKQQQHHQKADAPCTGHYQQLKVPAKRLGAAQNGAGIGRKEAQQKAQHDSAHHHHDQVDHQAASVGLLNFFTKGTAQLVKHTASSLLLAFCSESHRANYSGQKFSFTLVRIVISVQLMVV